MLLVALWCIAISWLFSWSLLFQDLKTTEELNTHIAEKQRLQAELEYQLGKSKDLMDEVEELRQNFLHQVTTVIC